MLAPCFTFSYALTFALCRFSLLSISFFLSFRTFAASSLFAFPIPVSDPILSLSLSLSFFLSPVSPSLSSSRSNHLASTNDIFFARDISREIYFASLKYSLVVCVLRSERKRERGESNDQRGTRRIVISLFAGQRRSSFQEGRFTQFANVCSAF